MHIFFPTECDGKVVTGIIVFQIIIECLHVALYSHGGVQVFRLLVQSMHHTNLEFSVC